MSTNQPQQETVLFTVRLWRTDLGQGQSEWRGRAQHVLSGETRCFRDWPGLIDALQALLADVRQTDDGC